MGNAGGALGGNLIKAGHTVTMATRDLNSESVQKALAKYPGLLAEKTTAALREAEVVFLATPYQANAVALAGLGPALAGKVLVDCANPVGAGLTHGLKSKISGAEAVQQLVLGAKVVTAFTFYGYENFIDSTYPGYGDLKPAMLIAGDDAAAKDTVGQLASDLGWRPVDVGGWPTACTLNT